MNAPHGHSLPQDIVFCKRCVMSNQRPTSMPEHRHLPERQGAKYLHIDSDGVCDACRMAEQKEKIDWIERERELRDLCDRNRRTWNTYDCIVPGSGGKDSGFQAHILKYKYNMHPLTVTWPPILYTDYGYENFCNWGSVGGLDNLSFRPNGKIHRLLTRLAIQNLLHPFQTFILGQKNLAPRIAVQMKIPLIFYGENEAEYGNPLADNATSLRDKSFYMLRDLDKVFIAGLEINQLIKDYGIDIYDLEPYLPVPANFLSKTLLEVHYLGYYLKWSPQEAYYYSVENTGFKPRPFRSEGTYSKYNSIDDKIDDLHYYTTYIKYGLGRASYDASQEIRNRHLTREEGILLVNRYDGEFPVRYTDEVFRYLGIDKEEFTGLCDKFRPQHLWERQQDIWRLKTNVGGNLYEKTNLHQM